MAPPKLNPHIRAIRGSAEKFNKHKEQTRTSRDALDKAIFEAKSDPDNGLTYKEIARESGLSVAWVQSALQRTGFKTSTRSSK